jgi:hypothetical protein
MLFDVCYSVVDKRTIKNIVPKEKWYNFIDYYLGFGWAHDKIELKEEKENPMNNRTKIGKKRHGTRIKCSFLRPMKKVRGKTKRKKYMVKIHWVSSTHFELQTSYATYRVPRSYSKFFANANQKILQNVVCCGYKLLATGEVLSTFYWFGLESMWDTDNFEQYKVES